MIDADLAGRILVASPLLKDPNFRRTVLFLVSHSAQEGAMGYVLNRPLDSQIEIDGEDGPLKADIHFGGPVHQDRLSIVSLQWKKPAGFVAFHAMEAEVEALPSVPKEWESGLRAFAGYSGWSAGQLEDEISQSAWLVVEPTESLITMHQPQAVWDQILSQCGPLMTLMAAAPDDPSKN